MIHEDSRRQTTVSAGLSVPFHAIGTPPLLVYSYPHSQGGALTNVQNHQRLCGSRSQEGKVDNYFAHSQDEIVQGTARWEKVLVL